MYYLVLLLKNKTTQVEKLEVVDQDTESQRMKDMIMEYLGTNQEVLDHL